MAIVNEPLAFHLCGVESNPLPFVGGKAKPLPDNLVIPPGRYSFNGSNFNLSQEGLYRFLFPPKENRQRIVYKSDTVSLISAISWMLSHGSRDNDKSVEQWREIAQREKVIITCGSAARFGVNLLAEQGIPSRVVNAKTLDKLNTYDNGHVQMEAWLDGKWTLVDLDVKLMFRSGGERLSLLEFSEKSQAGDYELEPLSAATGIAVGCFTQEGYDYGLFMESAFCNETCIRRWYKRIMRVPIIRDGEGWYVTGSPADMRKLKRHHDRNFVALSRDEFVNKFYKRPE